MSKQKCVAKSEIGKHDLLQPEPFTELVLKKEIFDEEDANGYVQDISYTPFMAVTYTKESIKVAQQYIKKGSGVFYLDATGTVVRGIYDERKLLYYALIVQVENSSSLSVMEYITDHQWTYFVVRPLLTFQGLLETKLKPKRVEVDFEWVLTYSVLLVFAYLKKAFNCLKGKEVLWRHKCTSLCCPYCTGFLGRRQTNILDKGLRKLCLRLVGGMVNCCSLDEARTIWRTWCVVFPSSREQQFTMTCTEKAGTIWRAKLVLCSCDKVYQEQSINFTRSDCYLTIITLNTWFKIDHLL